eukprot:jgi/Mesen1/9809/ME000007S09873
MCARSRLAMALVTPHNRARRLLHDNDLGGPLPDTLGQMLQLQVMTLSNNALGGSLPASFSQLSNLTELTARNCSLSQSVPTLGGMPNLMKLDLSHNNLTGDFPPAIGTVLKSLQLIDLENNFLTGYLLSSLATLENLQTLRAGHNKLGGTVPYLSGLPSLGQLSLPNNTLEEPVPTGLLNASSLSIDLSGNTELCANATGRLAVLCKPMGGEEDNEVLPTWQSATFCAGLRCKVDKAASPALFFLNSDSESSSSSSSSSAVQVRGAPQGGPQPHHPAVLGVHGCARDDAAPDALPEPAGPASASLSQVWVVSAATNPKKQQLVELQLFPPGGKPWEPSEQYRVASLIAGHSVNLGPQFGAYSVLSVQLAVPETKKGGGLAVGLVVLIVLLCVGSVALASVVVMALIGEVVAVKCSRPGSQQGAREFRNEVELLSGVCHKHLVALLGFCSEASEQLLVYEFVPQGNLFEQLHGKVKGAAPLSWRQRVNIALGAARGLAYLHSSIRPPIIHRDVKASNILITERREAKVADFGLSKLGQEECDDPAEAVPNRVMGTLGYLDPEYFMSDRLTEKSDVYALGVVLLELITARRPIENSKHIVRPCGADACWGEHAILISDVSDTHDSALVSMDSWPWPAGSGSGSGSGTLQGAAQTGPHAQRLGGQWSQENHKVSRFVGSAGTSSDLFASGSTAAVRSLGRAFGSTSSEGSGSTLSHGALAGSVWRSPPHAR